LLFNLPAKQSSGRVKVWRRLKKFGSVQLKTSTYVLPDEPVHYERFQWLGKQIVDTRGEATLVRVKDIEGMPNAAIVAMFNEARTRDYDELFEPLNLLIKDSKARKQSPETFSTQLQKLRQRFQEIRDIDYFQSSRGEDVQRLLQKAEALESSKKKPETVAGFWGSLVATVGIFPPSFLLILFVAAILIRHRDNSNVQGFVKGAYGAAIGTILGACVLLGKIAIGDCLTALIAIGSLIVLFKWKVSNPLLVGVTAAIGLIAFPLLQPQWVLLK
jgi:hypothetical protein